MSRIVLVLLVLGCAACGSAAPVVADGPPLAPPPPVVVAPAPELSAIEPAPPPPPLPEPPRGSFEERRAYPQVGVTEWTLANGLRVVYKRLPDTRSSFLSVASPEGAGGSGREAPWEVWPGRSHTERWITLPDGSLPAAVALAREAAGSGTTLRSVSVILVGPWPEGDVESVVGHGLSGLGGSGPRASSRATLSDDVRTRAEVPFRWADVPALLVVAAGLDARGGVDVRVGLDPREDTAALGLVGGGGAPDLASALRPFTPDDLVRARRQALDEWGPDAPGGWGRLLQALWAEPGDYRPARDPSVVGRILADLVRVSPESIEALLARLRASASPVSPR